MRRIYYIMCYFKLRASLLDKLILLYLFIYTSLYQILLLYQIIYQKEITINPKGRRTITTIAIMSKQKFT